jgi:RNA-directed DNA polymerase
MHSKPNFGGDLFRNLNNSPHQFYDEFSQAKRKFGGAQINSDGTPRMRIITRPIYSLKSKQKAVNDLLKQIDLPQCMFGGIVKKSSTLNSLEHLDKKHFFKIDLKNFFGNITNTRVHQMLICRGYNWEEARIITRLATFKGALPQGAPTSPTLANLVFAPTALLLENFCLERDITFTAFFDDLSFSSLHNFKHYTNEILKIILNNGFHLNHKKIAYRRHKCEITGLIVGSGKLSLPKQVLQNIHNPRVKAYVDHTLNTFSNISDKGRQA